MITGIQVLAFIGWMFLAWLTLSVMIALITYIYAMAVPDKSDMRPLGLAMLLAIAWPVMAWRWFIENLGDDDEIW